MARDTGAVCRICRRRGDKLYLKGERCYSPKCAFERRSNPPGPRPARRRKVSDRGLQLREKQRARATYGVLERQFLRYYKEAVRRPGVSGVNLVAILESRLDNTVYRAGFADSRAQARQLVRHGLITLNGRKTDIPSAQLRDGDIVGFTARGERSEHFKVLRETIASRTAPSWLVVDTAALTARVSGTPEVTQGDTHRFNENVVIEYYSR